ncbi:uncharacterized protein LOC142240762 [Haematobia irritans]|uniref:uncharacterized protein LOC142240762 n=1 Tax=Haematobia irritans TaxID=7368 RepID=UPI003F4FE445
MFTRRCFGLTVAWLNIFWYVCMGILCISLLATWNNTDKENPVNPATTKAAISYLVVCSIKTLTSGLLIYGIIQNRYKFMKLYLFISGTFITLEFLVVMAQVFMRDVKKTKQSLVALVIQIELLLPIGLLYAEIRESSPVYV